MSTPTPDGEPPAGAPADLGLKGRARKAARTAKEAAARVNPDQLAERFEQISEGLVDRVGTRLERRAPGRFAVAVLHQARLGLAWTIRSWRLVLLEIPSAALIAWTAYTVRMRALGLRDLNSYAIERYWVLFVLAFVLVLIAMTCNTVFAFALIRGRDHPAPIDEAWAETRARIGRIVAWAFAVSVAAVFLIWLSRRRERLGYTIVATGIVVLITIGLALVPARLTQVRKRRPTKDRLSRLRLVESKAMGTTAAWLVVIPTVVLVEFGRFLRRVPGLRWSGWLIAIVAGLLHTMAQSTARAWKLSATLVTSVDPEREAEEAHRTGDLEVGPGSPVVSPAPAPPPH
jgi:hypothetical protein